MAAAPAFAAGASVLGTGLQVAGAMTAEEQRTPGIVELPPEMEQEQIRIIQQSIEDFEKERARAAAVADQLYTRAQIESQVAEGLIPRREALEAITRQNEDIAQRFGDDILKTVDSLSKDTIGALGYDLEKDIRQQAQKELQQPFSEFKDPQVERELEEGQIKLEEELARRLGPGYANSEAGIRALNAFKQGATELRTRVSRETRAESVNRLGALSNIAGQTKQSQLAGRQSQMNFGELLFRGREASQDRLNQGFATASSVRQGMVQASQFGQQALNLSNIPFGQIQSFGQQELSDDIKNALQRGQYGGRFSNFQGQFDSDVARGDHTATYYNREVGKFYNPVTGKYQQTRWG